MSRYAVLPVGTDENTSRLTDAQFTQLAAQPAPVNQRPYVSPIAYLARQHTTRTGGNR